MALVPGLIKGLGVTARTMFPHPLRRRPAGGARPSKHSPHRAVPPCEGDATTRPGPRRDRPPRGETAPPACCVLGECPDWCIYIEGHKYLAPAPPGGRQAPPEERPRPLRHRLQPVYVLRHLRGGVPVRSAVLEPRVRVTPSPASPTCSTTKSALWSGWTPCPTFEAYEPGSEQKVLKVPR